MSTRLTPAATLLKTEAQLENLMSTRLTPAATLLETEAPLENLMLSHVEESSS